MLKGIILGLVIGIVLVFVGIYLYFATGQAPVATNASARVVGTPR